MSPGPAPGRAGTRPRGGHMLRALVGFGRALRDAGIGVTPAQLEDVARALAWVGLDDSDRVFAVCRSLLVTRQDDLALFETLFRWYFRPPGASAPARRHAMPAAPRHPRKERFTVATYAAFKARHATLELDVADRTGTYSAEDVLRSKRFADMSDEELRAVRRLITGLAWSASLRRTRRWRPDPHGRSIDLARVLRRAGRLGAVPAEIARRSRAVKPRPVVVLADVSGSMERHARLVLLFIHALTRTMPRVEAFVFGTRLTRITPHMRLRNLDRALDEAAFHVLDWSGGTRIGKSLATFNREWGRRVLRRGAVVVIVSDGCDRDAGRGLATEMRWLAHRCHRLIWLNPHLGHRAYEPRAAGMAAALPWIDDFLPVHDVQALEDFARALARIPPSGRSARSGSRIAHTPIVRTA